MFDFYNFSAHYTNNLKIKSSFFRKMKVLKTLFFLTIVLSHVYAGRHDEATTSYSGKEIATGEARERRGDLGMKYF